MAPASVGSTTTTPPRASPPVVQKKGPDLDYIMNMITTTCGGGTAFTTANDEIPGVEITYDVTTDTNKIFHVSLGDQKPSQAEVAQTHDHIHRSELSPEEKSQMWYTKDEIRKFRTNRRAVKKLQALKKQAAELQARLDPDDVASVELGSDATGANEGGSGTSLPHSVSWGVTETKPVRSPSSPPTTANLNLKRASTYDPNDDTRLSFSYDAVVAPTTIAHEKPISSTKKQIAHEKTTAMKKKQDPPEVDPTLPLLDTTLVDSSFVEALFLNDSEESDHSDKDPQEQEPKFDEKTKAVYTSTAATNKPTNMQAPTPSNISISTRNTSPRESHTDNQMNPISGGNFIDHHVVKNEKTLPVATKKVPDVQMYTQPRSDSPVSSTISGNNTLASAAAAAMATSDSPNKGKRRFTATNIGINEDISNEELSRIDNIHEIFFNVGLMKSLPPKRAVEVLPVETVSPSPPLTDENIKNTPNDDSSKVSTDDTEVEQPQQGTKSDNHGAGSFGVTASSPKKEKLVTTLANEEDVVNSILVGSWDNAGSVGVKATTMLRESEATIMSNTAGGMQTLSPSINDKPHSPTKGELILSNDLAHSEMARPFQSAKEEEEEEQLDLFAALRSGKEADGDFPPLEDSSSSSGSVESTHEEYPENHDSSVEFPQFEPFATEDLPKEHRLESPDVAQATTQLVVSQHIEYHDPSKSKDILKLEDIETRLAKLQAIDLATVKHRSPELFPLTRGYQDFRRQLHVLVKAVKSYQVAIFQMERARNMCFHECETLMEKTDRDISLDSGNKEGQHPSSRISLKTVRGIAQSDDQIGAHEYQQNIMDYIIQWEKVVTATIDSELSEVKKLQQNRLHYEKKVEGLRKRVLNLDSKGKELKAELVEKMDRNEIKLREAWKIHEERASKLCMLIEEATNQGWKDLIPLVGNLMKWECNRSVRDQNIYRHFNATTTTDPTILSEIFFGMDWPNLRHSDSGGEMVSQPA